MEFEQLLTSDDRKIELMSEVATQIVREHYDPILGKAQNDYMLEKFQSPAAIKNQLENGYRYYFVKENGRIAGFTAFYPRGEAMYLSKLYLYREERGKGYSRKMIEFIAKEAEKDGLNRIELNVNRFNSSVKVYESLGFRLLREEKIDIGSGYFMDDYVYYLDLR